MSRLGTGARPRVRRGARGVLVDAAALVRALETRRLLGAMLDVFETQPLPADHPLWGLQNVLVAPQVGGTWANFPECDTELIVRNVSGYRRGEPLEHRVDGERGH